jgi:hypothetical protein
LFAPYLYSVIGKFKHRRAELTETLMNLGTHL